MINFLVNKCFGKNIVVLGINRKCFNIIRYLSYILRYLVKLLCNFFDLGSLDFVKGFIRSEFVLIEILEK